MSKIRNIPFKLGQTQLPEKGQHKQSKCCQNQVRNLPISNGIYIFSFLTCFSGHLPLLERWDRAERGGRGTEGETEKRWPAAKLAEQPRLGLTPTCNLGVMLWPGIELGSPASQEYVLVTRHASRLIWHNLIAWTAVCNNMHCLSSLRPYWGYKISLLSLQFGWAWILKQLD